MPNKSKTNEVDKYIAGFPKDTQIFLKQLREVIMKAAPKAVEVISYKMPAYEYYGMLVYFAAYKNHIGFYPRVTGIEKFKKELSVYKGAKGSVQFPIDEPLPLQLIGKIVRFRAKENLNRVEVKAKKKK